MSAALTIDMREFNRAAELCIAHSERTYPQFINGQLLAVTSQAIKQTEKADANRIAYEMAGNVRTKLRTSRKTGKRSATRQYDVIETSLAARIINARLKASGMPLIWGKELAKAARRMIGARLRAVAFIRSGWVYAVRTLSREVGYSSGRADAAAMRGQPKGYAIPAKRVVSGAVTGTAVNTALIQNERTPMPVAMRGLQAAINYVARDMLDHLQKKLQPVLNQYSAR
jgi:hypothetical protein